MILRKTIVKSSTTDNFGNNSKYQGNKRKFNTDYSKWLNDALGPIKGFLRGSFIFNEKEEKNNHKDDIELRCDYTLTYINSTAYDIREVFAKKYILKIQYILRVILLNIFLIACY